MIRVILQNNRTVKYRAWDNVEKKMYYTGEEENIHFYLDSEGIVAERFGDRQVPIEDDLVDDVHCEKLEHLQYMMFTGLKDKRDNGIYEGDILKVEGSKRRYVVSWNEEEAAFTVRYKYANGDPGEWVISEFCHLMKSYEIIGNIFEEPELLVSGTEGRNKEWS